MKGIDEKTFFLLEDALARGIGFLKSAQKADGSFESGISTIPDMSAGIRTERSVFAAAVVLRCLRPLTGANFQSIDRAGMGFLSSEMSPESTWRYWVKDWPIAIPADLDDTACCLKLLGGSLSREQRACGIAQVIRNREASGLYKTWILDTAEHNDVDSVVNANVVAFLGSGSNTIDAIEYLIGVVDADKCRESSHYYLSEMSLFHAIALARESGVLDFDKVARRIVARIVDSSFQGNVLESAQAISTLLALGQDGGDWLGLTVERILEAQSPDGSWPLVPFYSGPRHPAPTSYWFGSREMTSAHCVEALARFLNAAPHGRRH